MNPAATKYWRAWIVKNLQESGKPVAQSGRKIHVSRETIVRSLQEDIGRSGMRILLTVLLVVGSLLLAFLLAGILFTNLRFFIWIGIIGLVIWGIYMLVTRPWRYS